MNENRPNYHRAVQELERRHRPKSANHPKEWLALRKATASRGRYCASPTIRSASPRDATPALRRKSGIGPRWPAIFDSVILKLPTWASSPRLNGGRIG